MLKIADYLKMSYTIKFYINIAKLILSRMGLTAIANPRVMLNLGTAKDMLIEVWMRLEKYSALLGNFDIIFLSAKVKA